MLTDHAHHLLLVFAAYLFAIASPGPSTMAIMAVAMKQGRKSAVFLALGVVTGSMIWAVLAATGLSAVLTAYAQAIFAIKIAGGCYLLYLAWKSARSALSAHAGAMSSVGGMKAGMKTAALYRRGVLLHLSNPKAVLGWLAIMSLGLRPDAPPHTMMTIIAGCAVLGLMVNLGYAVVFSTAALGRAYQRARRWIEGGFAALFGYAGLRLLLSKPSAVP